MWPLEAAFFEQATENVNIFYGRFRQIRLSIFDAKGTPRSGGPVFGESDRVANPKLTVKKVLLSVWRDWQKIIYALTAKLLIQTFTVSNCTFWRLQSPRSDQLWPIGEELYFIRTTPVYMHRLSRQKLRELDWWVLMHRPYSPNLEPSEYYLFLFMASDFAGKNLVFRETCENLLTQFFWQYWRIRLNDCRLFTQ